MWDCVKLGAPWKYLSNDTSNESLAPVDQKLERVFYLE